MGLVRALIAPNAINASALAMLVTHDDDAIATPSRHALHWCALVLIGAQAGQNGMRIKLD